MMGLDSKVLASASKAKLSITPDCSSLISIKRHGAVVRQFVDSNQRLLTERWVGVWPAFWTVGPDPWPYVCEASHVLLVFTDLVSQTGEIDIIEGVHDNEHNQVAWHSGPGVPLFDLPIPKPLLTWGKVAH
jgi:hypothetical protein